MQERGLIRRIELLQILADVSAALSAAATPDEVAAAMLASGMATLGADAGFVGRLVEDGSALRVIRLAGYEPDQAEQFELPLDAPYPLAEALRRSESLYIGSNEQLRCDFPGLRRITDDDHACATVPLSSPRGPVGSLNIGFSEPRLFSADEIELIEELGRRCAQALARAEDYLAEVDGRRRAEQELRELRAFELNDDVVQELAVAKLAFETGRREEAEAAVARALEGSKALLARMSDGAVSFRRV